MNDKAERKDQAATTLRGAFHLIRTDFRRYRSADGGGSFLGVCLLTQGFWASSAYRIGHWLEFGGGLRPIRRLLGKAFLFIQKLVEILTGLCIPATCSIGEGLYIGHFGPLIIHPRAEVGHNCNLSHGVTLGKAHRGAKRGIPRLGDRVYVGPNAVIVGDITVGDDAAIGAGTVVIDSVPPRAVVAGNPGRVVSTKGSFEMVSYEGMESDPSRLDSLSIRDAESGSGSENVTR